MLYLLLQSFFGRNKHLRLVQIEACKNGGNCTINQETRATCKYCRFQKCLKVGMSKERSTYGRRSNSFKQTHFANATNQQDNQNTHERSYLRVPDISAIALRSVPSQNSIHEGIMPSDRQENLLALNQSQRHDSLLQATASCQLTNDQLRRNNSSLEKSVSNQQQSSVLNVSIPSTSRNTLSSSVPTIQQYTTILNSIQQQYIFRHVQMLLQLKRTIELTESNNWQTNGQMIIRLINEFIDYKRNLFYDVNYLNQILLPTSSIEPSREPTNLQINLSREIGLETSVTEPSSQSAVNVTQTEPLNLSVDNERRMQNRGQKRKREVK